jgi:tetratricopeptide (TPR) repeat protein
VRAASCTSEGPPSAGWWQRLTSRRTAALRRGWPLLVLLGVIVGAGFVVYPHLRAWHHLRAARVESQCYHTAQAIRHLRICRDIWPRDAEVLLLAARAARRAGVYDDTERLLSLYRERRGNDDDFAFEHLLLAAERRVDEVEELCWSYVEKGHGDTGLLLEALTRGYSRQYRYGQARMCLNRWKKLQPDNRQVYCLEGLFLLDHLHAMSSAADSFRRALELDPDHEEARLGLAIALLEGKSYAQAAKHFEHLQRCQPDNLRVQVGLAECHEGLGDTAEAERLVDDALARQPQMEAALSLRGKLALKNGQPEEGANWLRQALRRKPLDHAARYSLILCLEQSGQEKEAQEQRQRLQQLEDDMARFHDIVTQEIAQRPTDPALHCTLGKLLLRAGQREEGLRWLQSALRLDPRYAPARQAVEDYQKEGKSEPRP